jgi:branched-chain amino acid transport system substrate-binding protein
MYGADRPSTTEASYNYTLMHALAGAMKLAGTTSDTAAIRAKIGEALAKLPPEINAGNFGGVDAKGGTLVEPRVVVVENAQIKQVQLGELGK